MSTTNKSEIIRAPRINETAPDFAAHEPSRDGSARNQHRPEVPDIRPGRLRPGTPPIRNQAFARLHSDFKS